MFISRYCSHKWDIIFDSISYRRLRLVEEVAGKNVQLFPGSEINTRQAPNAGRFSVWRVNFKRLSATLAGECSYQNSNVIISVFPTMYSSAPLQKLSMISNIATFTYTLTLRRSRPPVFPSAPLFMVA